MSKTNEHDLVPTNKENEKAPPKNVPAILPPPPPPVFDVQIMPGNKENIQEENAIIPFEPNLNENDTHQVAPMAPADPTKVVTNTQNNLLKQAPILFGGATFNNCTINLQMLQ